VWDEVSNDLTWLLASLASVFRQALGAIHALVASLRHSMSSHLSWPTWSAIAAGGCVRAVRRDGSGVQAVMFACS
jgi:hypothetical protein